MDDYIRRNDAIEVVQEYMKRQMMAHPKQKDRIWEMRLDLYGELVTIPADGREERLAEWIESSTRTYGRSRTCCSRCGAFALYEFINVGSFGEQLTNYCPNCGADMREVVY